MVIVDVYHLSAGGDDEDQGLSQQVKVDATSPSPVTSISFGISPNVTTGGDLVTNLNAENIDKDVELFTAIGTKMNPQKWVKKHESQVGELDQFKLKTVALHDDRDEEIHMIQSD